ncbi:50S ribosomal protein L15 [Candidatus Karelsulcia muelleri]
MILTHLTPIKGSNKKSKRLGRGKGSGKGKTSTRGNKGAKSRSGNSVKLGFEGGQMPFHKRIPKFGFKNLKKKTYKIFNLETLEDLINLGKVKRNLINNNVLRQIGLLKKKELVKILGRGELTHKIKIFAHKFSKKASLKIKNLGGNTIMVKNKYDERKIY